MTLLVKQIRWKVLLLSLVAQFAVTALLHLGVKAPQVLNFLSLPKIEAVLDFPPPAVRQLVSAGYLFTVNPR